MSVIDSINEASNKAINQSEEYFKKSHEYYKLKIFQQLSLSISMVFKAVAIGGIFVIGLAFFAVALALYIGSFVNNYALGFLAVGLLFILCAGMLLLFRNFVDAKVIKEISKTFFK